MPSEEHDAFRAELKRKAFHQLILAYLGAYFLLGRSVMLQTMTFWALFVLAADILRLKTSWMRRLAGRMFAEIMRGKESDRLSGMSYAALGVLATFYLYGASPRVVTAALLCLTLGDAVSCLVGLGVGKHPYVILGMKRTIEGTLAGFAAAMLIGLAGGFSILVSTGAALAFSVIDTLPVPPDDNLWIPVVSAAALRFLS